MIYSKNYRKTFDNESKWVHGELITLLIGRNKYMTWSEIFCSRIIHFLAQGIPAELLKG